MKECSISDLVGVTLDKVSGKVGDDEMVFESGSNRWRMFHYQDCCEGVSVEDINGDLEDLVGVPILEAYESTSEENPEGVKMDYQDCFLWTFYRLVTIKGTVVIRWYGESNGYYGVSVSFEKEITYNKALAALREVVEEAGEGYTYKTNSSEACYYTSAAAKYVYDPCEGCGIGRALIKCGVSPLYLREVEEFTCQNTSIRGYAEWPNRPFTLDPMSLNLFSTFQSRQDGGETWGECLAGAIKACGKEE